MHRPVTTRRQELVLEGRWHFPLDLLDFERFRRWRHSDRCPQSIKASYLGGMVYIETGLDWSVHFGKGYGRDVDPPELPEEADQKACFCFDGWFYVPATAFELEGFRDWIHSDWFPEKVKATFINGSVEVEMSPEEQESHGKLKVELIVELGRFIKKLGLGDLFSDSTTVVLPAAGLLAEPHIVFCSWDGYRCGRVRQNERVPGSERFVDLVGAPDLIVEVVSEGSVKKDKRRLRAAYCKAGVPEYWLVDGRWKKGVRFELLVRGDTDYEALEPDADGYRFSPTFQRSFRIVRRRNPVGRYSYRLLHRKTENP
jgi:Uma2 family endonuclease